MEQSTVIRLDDRRTRETMIGNARDARRRLDQADDEPGRRRGRIWINGVELGGPERRFAHLSVSHD